MCGVLTMTLLDASRAKARWCQSAVRKTRAACAGGEMDCRCHAVLGLSLLAFLARLFAQAVQTVRLACDQL